MSYRFLRYALILILISCHRPAKEYSLTLVQTTLLDSIPSASGIATQEDSVYIVGDDASKIYQTSLSNYHSRRFNLLFTDSNLFRIPKPVKHDYEAATIAMVDKAKYLVAFGSGTLSPYRDSLWMMRVGNERDQHKYSLRPFFDAVISKSRIQPKDLNIEGATIAGNSLFLFNRGNNVVVETDWQQFIGYVRDSYVKMPAFRIYTLSLPALNGKTAGFSGACTLDEHTILFTASIENTKDWTKDGEILGSYLGIIALTAKRPHLQQAILVQKDNKPLMIKLESLDVVSKSPSKIEVEAVTDNDDGTSTAYRFLLQNF